MAENPWLHHAFCDRGRSTVKVAVSQLQVSGGSVQMCLTNTTTAQCDVGYFCTPLTPSDIDSLWSMDTGVLPHTLHPALTARKLRTQNGDPCLC